MGPAIIAAAFTGNFEEGDRLATLGRRLASHVDKQSVWAASVLNSEGMLRLQEGRLEEAVEVSRKAGGIALVAYGESSPLGAQALQTEGEVLDRQGRFAEAREVLVRSLAAYAKFAGADADDPVEALRSMGVAQIGLGHPKEAIPFLEQALAREGKHHAFAGQIANIRFTLARALLASNTDTPRAGELAEKARTELVTVPWRKSQLEEVESWMKANGIR